MIRSLPAYQSMLPVLAWCAIALANDARAFTVNIGTGTRALYLQVGIGVDGSGVVYLTGVTTSTDFPTTLGAPQTANAGGQDAYVVTLDLSAGTSGLRFGTYLGGTAADGRNE